MTGPPGPGRPGWLEGRTVRTLGRRQGRPLGLLVLLGLVGLLLGPEPAALRDLRFLWFDAYQIAAPRTRAADPVLGVTIVEIDEASLGRYGQWPWPRTLLARLITTIADGDPAVIGLDMVMPEADRLSPGQLPLLLPDLEPDLAGRLRRLPSNDTALARALQGRPVVVGVAGLAAPPGPAPPTPGRRPPIRLVGGDPSGAVTRFPGVLRSLEEIDAAAAGHGLLNPEPGARIVRRIPLVAQAGDALMPTLGLEMLRVASGAPGLTVWMGREGVTAVGVADLVVPTQPDGMVWLRYSPPDPARFVSAGAVLDGKASGARFARKLVLVGVTAVGLGDSHATPVASRMPGTEIQAQLLEGILDAALLTRPRPAPWAEAAFLAGGGLLLVLALPARSVAASSALALALAAAGPLLGFLAYRRPGLLLDAATPTLGLGLLFVVMLGVTLTEFRRQRLTLRRELQQEREAAARVAGELSAARRIQMASLPDAARAFPGETRFELYTWLEPARMVGGDLYDFFRLDGQRVFLLVGDVSGKGVPGSLFMAVSKALCKSSALRMGGDPGPVLREANAEMARDNGEGMFVTVFAAVLHATTGELAYCNAGHEVACLLGADGGVTRLAASEGPPLCVVDDFPYQAAVHRLRPGERVCLVTDGVTEAMDATGALYGRERLLAMLAGLPAGSAEAAGQAVLADLQRFVGPAEQSDDAALLILRWHGPGPGPAGSEIAPISGC